MKQIVSKNTRTTDFLNESKYDKYQIYGGAPFQRGGAPAKKKNSNVVVNLQVKVPLVHVPPLKTRQ